MQKWPGYYSKQVGNNILLLLAKLYSFNEQYFNWSLSDRLDCWQYRQAISHVTRFILLPLDIMRWGCVYRCVCVCVGVFEHVQENSFRSITSQQELAVIGVRAARLMSVAKASLSKPDSRQADQYNLCHLGASLSLFLFCLFYHFHFSFNSLFCVSIQTLSSLRFKSHKKDKWDLFNIYFFFFSQQQCN